jgi:hypothetical protein
MRSKCRTVLVVLVAMLALSAAASASASAALPEFYPSHFSFSTSSGGSSSFQESNSGVPKVPTCESHATKGTITGVKSGTVEVELKGCHGFSASCNTTGQASGVVVFSGAIEPVYLTKEPQKVGLLVHVNEFTAYCGFSTATISGSFLGSITPINTKVKATQSFALVAKQSEGVNEFVTYETAAGERKAAYLLESLAKGPFVQAGYESTEVLRPSIESELKA